MPATDAPMTRPTAMAPDASTSPVDWLGALEAVHNNGRVVAIAKADVTKMSDTAWAAQVDVGCARLFNLDGTPIGITGWRIRNVQPTTPELDPALWDRMVALVRRMGTIYRDAGSPAELPPRNYDMRDYAEARDIQNLLPKPVDPDLIEAREIAASMLEVAQGGTHIEETRRGERDGYVHVCIALAGIQRGRELAAPEVSHVG